MLALPHSPAGKRPQAHAFDCAKAKTGVEKAICADPALKKIDDDLAAAYGAVKAGLAEAEQKMMTISQKRWIARREGCGSDGQDLAACVKQKTEERLALLTGTAASGPGAPGKLVPHLHRADGNARQL